MALQKLNDTMSATQNYEAKRFKGTVVDNVDPLNQGRVKVRIPGLYEEGELPWVGVLKASPFGYGPGFGVYGAPTVGSVVEIQLQEGSASHPISSGGLADLTTNRDNEFNKQNVWGYKDPSGNKLVVDQDARTFSFTHSSGSRYEFDGDGNLLVEGSGTATVKFPNIILDGDVLVTGELTVQQLTTLLNGFVAAARSGGASVMQGDVVHSNGTFRSNNVTVHLHIHPTPEGDSGSPKPGT